MIYWERSGGSFTIRILFIDDEDALLHMCKTYLERSNDLQVSTARSVKDADDLMGETRFDAIVSDYQMPWRTGLEMLKRLRMKKDRTPFIFFTGKGNEDVAIEALNSGADYYIMKGGDPKAKFAELEHAIRDSVHERRWESALRLKNMAFEESSTAIIVTEPHFTITECNEAFLRMWGITTKNDVIGNALSNYFQTADVLDVIASSMSILGRWEGEFTAKRKAGSTFIAYGLVSSLYGGSDKPTGYLISVTDASKRKQSSATPDAPKPVDQFKLIAECCGDWLALVDSTGAFTYSSPSSVQIAGYTPEELKGSIMDGYVHPDDIPMMTDKLRLLFEKGESVPFEFRFHAKDGNYISLESKVSLINEGEERPFKILFQNRDLSHRATPEEVAAAPVPEPVPAEPEPVAEVEVPGVTAESVEETSGDVFVPIPAPAEVEIVEVAPEPEPVATAPSYKIERKDDLEMLVVLSDLILQEKGKGGEPGTVENLNRMDDIVVRMLAHAKHAQDYAAIGGEPVWVPVQELFRSTTSGMDMGVVHVQLLTKRLEVRADPLLERVFRSLLEFTMANDPRAYKVWITYEQMGDQVKLLYEDNGKGVADDIKPLLFRPGDDKYHGLALSKEILKATGIGIEENGVPGKGVRFELTIPTDQFRIH